MATSSGLIMQICLILALSLRCRLLQICLGKCPLYKLRSASAYNQPTNYLSIVQTQISLGIQSTDKIPVYPSNSDQPGHLTNQQNTCPSFKLRSDWVFNQPYCTNSDQPGYSINQQITCPLNKLRSAWVFNQPTKYLSILQTQISLGIQSTNKIPVHPTNSDQPGYSTNQQNTCPSYKLRSAWIFNQPTKYLSIEQSGQPGYSTNEILVHHTNSDQPGYSTNPIVETKISLGIQPTPSYKLRSAWVFTQSGQSAVSMKQLPTECTHCKADSAIRNIKGPLKAQ